jgi:hypothetical protein
MKSLCYYEHRIDNTFQPPFIEDLKPKNVYGKVPLNMKKTFRKPTENFCRIFSVVSLARL